MHYTKLFVLAFAVSLAALSADAATLYVSTGGNDANPGTLSAPFRTITKASSLAKPGDVVNVRGGVYYEIVKIGARGTSTARIRFQSNPGELAIIDGTGSAAGTNLVQISSAEYVDFHGFEVRNATRIGICGWGTRNVAITGNDVHHSLRNGIWVGYSAPGSTYDIRIEGNKVHNNVVENQYHTMSGGWAQAVGISKADRVTVRSNRIYQNDGEGLAFVVSDGSVAEANELFDNFSVGIYLDNAQTSKVNGNLIYSTGNSRYFRGGYPAAGIGVANEAYDYSNPSTGNRITNNIVVNTKWGFYYGAYENGGGLLSTTVANNTFHRSSQAMLWIEQDTHSGSSIINNIFYQAGGAAIASVAGSGVTYRSNVWYGGWPGAAAGTGDLLSDPKLTNPGGLTAADYKLLVGSLATDAGIATSAVTTDFWGVARTAVPDLGAHEQTAATATAPIEPAPTPITDTQAPTAPTSLSIASVSTTYVGLRWNAASDNVGVTGYQVFRNGVRVATVTGTSWTNSGLTSGTTYTFTVKAVDAAGNVSAASNSLQASTTAATTSKKRRVR